MLAASCIAAADEPAAKTFVAVIDLQSAPPKIGSDLSDRIRLRLRRHNEYDVIDRLTTTDLTAPLPADAPLPQLAAMMTDKLGVQLCLLGSAVKTGRKLSATVRLVDLRDPNNPVEWTQTFTDATERQAGLIARRVVEAVRDKPEWSPPEYGDDPEPAAADLGKPINENGAFDAGPAGWEGPDNVATFLIKTPQRGTVLRVRTDLQAAPYVAYRRGLLTGTASRERPPVIARDVSYGCIGGLEGVHYRSVWIRAAPGKRYWLTADVKGASSGIFAPKVFVKGFRDASAEADGLGEQSLSERRLTPKQFAALPEAKRKALLAADVKAHPDRYRRECYRWYLHCRNADNEWKHFAAPFPPRGGLPANVQWLRIDIYTYWPPGEYLWDNVHLYLAPKAVAPAASAEEDVGPQRLRVHREKKRFHF